MFQRLKNKKGFTLIELIVVIAILGILALIAIPRFAGFTDRAKIRADEQYATLVGNSVMTLAAAGDFVLGTNPSVTINNAGATSFTNITLRTGYTPLVTATGGTGGDAAGTMTYLLTQLVGVKAPQYYNLTASNMVVTIDANGIVSIAGTR